MIPFSRLSMFGRRRAAGGGTPAPIPQGTGTAIGSMTSNGGVAASFDSTTSQALASCSRGPGSTPYGNVGKDWGSGNSYTITKYVVYSPSDLWFEAFTTTDIRIALYGSNSAPGSWNGTDFGGTQLHTQTLTATGSTGYVHTVTSGITTTTAYRYHWVVIHAQVGSNEVYCAEVEFEGY